MNLPIEFLNNMQNLLGKDYEKFYKSMNNESIKGLRVNTKKIDIDTLKTLIPSLKDKIPYTNAFYIDAKEKYGSSPYHHAGLFYIQEPSAMQPALCTDINKDAVVLDMCASPGGKSGQLAEMLNDNGVLVSNEIITSRATILKENMDRLGYKNVIVTSTTPQNLTRIGKIFDVILIDAPCSGEGLFRRDESAVKQWNDGINEMNATRQLELLNLATKMLKDGGKIIYSTCTFSKLENEDVVDKFLNDNPDFKLNEINENLKDYSSSLIKPNCQRVMPHLHKGEGQFYACLQNTNPNQIDNKHYDYLENLKQSEKTILKDFISSTINDINLNEIKSYQGNILLPPKREINTKSIFILKYGINMGKIEKNRFIPNHNLFTSLGNKFKLKINLTDEKNVIKYLKGEQLEVDDTTMKGYVVVCVNGFALGGGKVQNGKVNNLYPKYLRIN